MKYPEYSTGKNLLPIFEVDVMEDAPKAYEVEEVINNEFVEQYLKYFMPSSEFNELFKR